MGPSAGKQGTRYFASNCWTHIEPEDAEVEDAAQLLAVILPNAVQVLALPGRIRRKGISRGRPGNVLCRQDPVRGLVEPQLLPGVSDVLHMPQSMALHQGIERWR